MTVHADGISCCKGPCSDRVDDAVESFVAQLCGDVGEGERIAIEACRTRCAFTYISETDGASRVGSNWTRDRVGRLLWTVESDGALSVPSTHQVESLRSGRHGVLDAEVASIANTSWLRGCEIRAVVTRGTVEAPSVVDSVGDRIESSWLAGSCELRSCWAVETGGTRSNIVGETFTKASETLFTCCAGRLVPVNVIGLGGADGLFVGAKYTWVRLDGVVARSSWVLVRNS